jgi:glucosamine-6-phosphate deaminase
VDVACVEIGVNGSLAFNVPPADFETDGAYAVVRLSAECRARLIDQGWFLSEEDVPKHAVCMSVPQIMRCRSIICVGEGAQRAAAVHNMLRGPISNLCPASVLQVHPDCTVFLDSECASVFWRRIGNGVRARQDEEENG